MKRGTCIVFVFLFILSVTSCKKNSFESMGTFTVNRHEGYTEVGDGIGRRFILVPREKEIPANIGNAIVIRTPVNRVIAYSTCDISFLIGFGILEEVLVGVTVDKSRWSNEFIKESLDSGKIVFIGDSSMINYELMKKVQPDVVFTWDSGIIPVLDELKIPTLITNPELAMGLEAQIKYVKFIAPFFHKAKEAELFCDKFMKTAEEIKAKADTAKERPRVIWGDVYNKRVLVEPRNAWVSELVRLSGGIYELDDVEGASCLEITLERFFLAGKKADIMFTYRSPRTGINTKRQLSIENPVMGQIRPMTEGDIYFPKDIYYESYHKLDDIMMEIASILQPEIFGEPEYKYFLKLK
ncbi:MAG: ABC transporter substrate-binding protein [Spirochaetes bacterium]|nr:ABC transporter substrate-binding protein [Spirochaetota bacterium]